ncbi:NACHT domain-containing protein [Streptomyces sp. NPDC058255]|uniref:NACHT domain-containing protein n=1 Tax=Streptomyces sp. NPDC058255 TaxID=3346407 RepID=UPI0036E7AF41
MDRRGRHYALYGVGLFLVTLGLAAILRQLRADDWKISLEVLGASLGLATVAVSLQLWHRRAIGRAVVTAPDDAVVAAKARLAQQVQKIWQDEARMRDQDGSRPIPVTWQYIDRQGAVTEVALAGATTPDEALHQADLLARKFLASPSRRLIVVGARGTGKTTVALQLTLALLRPVTSGPERPPLDVVPLPVSAADWSAGRADFVDWIAQEVSRLCPDVPSKGWDIPGRLVENAHVVPVLDGLDEIPASQRAEVFAALSDVTTPLILTCRTEEFEEALQTQGGLLHDASRIRPEPLTPAAAATHLRAYLRPGSESAWEELLAALEGPGPHTGPVGVLAAAVASPLDLGLLRITYAQPGTSPAELLRPDAYADVPALRGHFFDLLIPKVLRSRPPNKKLPAHLRPSRPYKARDVRQWLGFLAATLAQPDQPVRRDLSWWFLGARTLPSWVLAAVQAAIWTVLGTVAGVAIGRYAPYAEMPDGGTWTVALLAFLLGGGASAYYAPDALYSGPRYTHLVTTRSGPGLGRLALLGTLIGASTVTAIVAFNYAGEWFWRAVTEDSGGALLPDGVTPLLLAFPYGALGGLLFGLVLGTDSALAGGRVHTPIGSLRVDRFGGLLRMATVFFIAGPLIGWTAWENRRDDEVVAGMIFWILLVVGTTLFSGRRAWFVYAVAVGHAAARRRLPLGLMPFLDDAHRLGLMRAVGPVYQFRHAEFQDHLARWYRQTHPGQVTGEPTGDPQPRNQVWFIVSSIAVGLGLACADTLVRTAGTAPTTDLVANGGGVLLGVLGAGHLLWTWRAARRH